MMMTVTVTMFIILEKESLKDNWVSLRGTLTLLYSLQDHPHTILLARVNNICSDVQKSQA